MPAAVEIRVANRALPFVTAAAVAAGLDLDVRRITRHDTWFVVRRPRRADGAAMTEAPPMRGDPGGRASVRDGGGGTGAPPPPPTRRGLRGWRSPRR